MYVVPQRSDGTGFVVVMNRAISRGLYGSYPRGRIGSLQALASRKVADGGDLTLH
ncbi:hypothetical protein RCH23_002346 [Cryobacterium sp. CAN_C3]|nr:hypothetical protein [Cryobacterium sp. CAN_C3]